MCANNNNNHINIQYQLSNIINIVPSISVIKHQTIANL